MSGLLTVSIVLRAVILYLGVWALVTVVPAFVWSKPPRNSAKGRPGSRGPRRRGRTLEGFLKLWLRIFVRGHRLIAISLYRFGYYLGATIGIVAGIIGLVLTMVVAAVAAFLFYVVLPIVLLVVGTVAACGAAYLLYQWALTAIAMVKAFVRWDLATLASLSGPFLGLSLAFLAPLSLYAVWKHRKNKIERYERLKRIRKSAAYYREERRREALESELETVEPVRQAPQPAPPPSRPRTIMEATRPELVAEARPAARRPDPKLVRRPIPKPEDRPRSVDWEAADGA